MSYWTTVSEAVANDGDDADAENDTGDDHIRRTFVPSPSLLDLSARGSLKFVIVGVHSRGEPLLIKDLYQHAHNKNLLLSTCRHASFNCFTR